MKYEKAKTCSQYVFQVPEKIYMCEDDCCTTVQLIFVQAGKTNATGVFLQVLNF